MAVKYVVVTGGVLSGLGKGVTTASIGRMLKAYGFSVSAMKIDPYLNYDAGTMNPFLHGEVFVCEDGGETDMDLGTYERFLDISLTKEHNITTGQIYDTVIKRERRGDYLGQCVQVIPHITDEIKRRITERAERDGVDIMMVECGGTVGDIEGLPFLEALRQLRLDLGPENIVFVHVTLVPRLTSTGEHKTKPTQHSVQELRRIGIQPDFIVVRSDSMIGKETRRKIALFTNVPQSRIFCVSDVSNIYRIPLLLDEQGLGRELLNALHLESRRKDWGGWDEMVLRYEVESPVVRIAICGKYVGMADTYVSVKEAVKHAAAKLLLKPVIDVIDVEKFEADPEAVSELEAYDALIVPGGFGVRGVEGKIRTIKFAMDSGKPYLGLCFGFQLAVVAFARFALGLEDANSTEIDPHTPHPVIDLLPEQRRIRELGGTMRLGASDIAIKAGTLAHKLYGAERISRRHRHRYEVNPAYLDRLESGGLVVSGTSVERGTVEIIELPSHPYFIATQYHPEFSSRPMTPEPVFVGLLEAARWG